MGEFTLLEWLILISPPPLGDEGSDMLTFALINIYFFMLTGYFLSEFWSRIVVLGFKGRLARGDKGSIVWLKIYLSFAARMMKSFESSSLGWMFGFMLMFLDTIPDFGLYLFWLEIIFSLASLRWICYSLKISRAGFFKAWEDGELRFSLWTGDFDYKRLRYGLVAPLLYKLVGLIILGV